MPAAAPTPPEQTGSARPAGVTVVGCGITGVACARAVRAAAPDLPLELLDRGHRIGGRMAVRTVDGRPVDVGASYLTAHDPDFLAVVRDWCARGVAREWTDTFHLATPEGLAGTTTGPMRYAAAGGLRSLVEDLAVGLPVRHPQEVEGIGRGPTVDGRPVAAVALAMPDPQARDLLADDLVDELAVTTGRVWEPVLALAAGWSRRTWPQLDGVFVNDSPVLTFVADDGARRGDGAPVLVAHADPVFSARHQDDPAAAVPVLLAELRLVLGIAEEPAWVEIRRWGSARPCEVRDEPFHLGPERVGLAGDGWTRRSRIEAAYLSGRALGTGIAAALR